MLRKFIQWGLVAAILCTGNVLTSCENANAGENISSVESTELLRTSKSWNDADLPDYPQGQPEIVAIKYVIPAGEKLGWHHQIAMNHGVLVQGELTIIGLDGEIKVVKAGEVVVEMVDAIHRGENRGTEPVVLYMFYLSQKDKDLTVQNPEIPME